MDVPIIPASHPKVEVLGHPPFADGNATSLRGKGLLRQISSKAHTEPRATQQEPPKENHS